MPPHPSATAIQNDSDDAPACAAEGHSRLLCDFDAVSRRDGVSVRERVNGGLNGRFWRFVGGSDKHGEMHKLAPADSRIMMTQTGPVAIAEISALFIVYMVVFGGFACLFPLAFYCLILASWNSRRRPLFVSGPADFAGVLLATSGFLITGGPLILALLHDKSELSAGYPNFAAAWSAQAGLTWPWLLAWLGYFVVVVGGQAWLLSAQAIRQRHLQH